MKEVYGPEIRGPNGPLTLESHAYFETENIQYLGFHEFYQAIAHDEDGNMYEVRWEILEGFDPENGEDTACDWNDYTIKPL